jgi:hypothetical protein
MSDIVKDIKSAVEDCQDERMTCEKVFELVEPHRYVVGLDSKYEEIRADYNKATQIHHDVEQKMRDLKTEMASVEDEMNRQVGHISQDLFTKHYQVVRDLTETSGLEAAIILRRASSGVVFLDKINGLAS